MKHILVFFLGFCLVQDAISKRKNPMKDPFVCGRPKCELISAGVKFKYAPGTQQTHDYSIDIVTQFSGNSNGNVHENSNSSRLHINAKVVLSWTSSCDGFLRLTDVVLKEAPDKYDRIEDIDYETLPHDNSPYFAQALQQFPLRFSFQDGAISELCPHEDEKTWALNTKRGILSMMHNTMERLDVDYKTVETDIHGDCPTTYNLQGAHGTSLMIEKTKQLSDCDRRHKLQSVVRTTHYRTRKGRPKILPLVESSLQCDLSIDHNVYNQIECRQVLSFEPFTGKKTGAVTTTTQKLKLQTEDETSENLDLYELTKRTNLLYDHYHSPKPTVGELKSARWLIKQMCEFSNEDSNEMSSDIFSRYVRSARLISYTALYHLYLRTGTICPSGRRHFTDALPFLGSAASVELMRKLIMDGAVGVDVVEDWMTTVASIPVPEEAMLLPLRQLLKHFPADSTVALSVSTVAGSFCRNAPDCQANKHLNSILELLTSRIRKPTDDTQLLICLKSIGNVGVKTEEIEDLLINIVKDEKHELEIRLAAVDSHRRFNCEESRNSFMDILKNQGADSEIRIGSYLQAMRCPNYRVIDVIRRLLEEEQVNQVGSFIWSHLTNLAKSSSPANLEIQTLLYGKELNKKFSGDVRKFSTNFQGSVFLNEYNLGAGYDGNLVFSTASYVPRSGTFNFSMDLFGESVNFFEVAGRVEGLERYAENFFGPKGPVRKIKDKLSRFAREVGRNEILEKGAASLPNVMKDKFGDPKLSFGVKVFGNELQHYRYNGQNEISQALNKFNPTENIKLLLSGREISYRKVGMFLDTSLVVPTSTGFPLLLNALGTSNVDLKLFGTAKGANFTNDLTLDLQFKLKPSATVNLLSTVSVDAYWTSTAVKIKANVHTSTSIESHVKLRGLNLISAKFTLPKDKTHVISATSELLVQKDNEEEPQTGPAPLISTSKCTSSWTYETFGLTACTSHTRPNVSDASFLLTGPLKYSVVIPKADPTAKVYTVDFAWNRKENTTEALFLYTTPGSSQKKHLMTNLTIDRRLQNFELVVKSTQGVAHSKGKYNFTTNERYLYFDMETGGKKQLDVGVSLTRKNNKNIQIFSPRLYVAMHDERIVDLNGTVRLISKLLQATDQYDIDLSFRTKNISSRSEGQIVRTLQTFSANSNTSYTLSGYEEEFVVFGLKTSTTNVNHAKTLSHEYSFESSEFPRFNAGLVSKIQQSSGRSEAKFEIRYGLHRNDPERLLTVACASVSTAKPDGKKTNIVLRAQQQHGGLDFKNQFVFDQTGASFNTIWTLQFSREKIFNLDVYLYAPRSTLLFLESRINFTVPSFHPFLLEGKIHEKISREFDLDVKSQWFNGYNLSTKGKYQDASTLNASTHYLKLLLESNRFQDVHLTLVQLQDRSDFKTDVKALQSEKEYSFLLKHSVNNSSGKYFTSFAQLRWDDESYHVKTGLELSKHQRLSVDCHLDRWRDLQLELKGISEEGLKEVDFEIKWDVNRDPEQKLSTLLRYRKPENHAYDGLFELNYPGRSVNFDFTLKPQQFHCSTRVKYVWNYEKFVEMKASSDVTAKTILLRSEARTSFPNWEKTTAYFESSSNLVNSNGGSECDSSVIAEVFWGEDQSFASRMEGNWSLIGTVFAGFLTGDVKSTLDFIPEVKTTFKHFQNTTRIDTEHWLRYKFPYKTKSEEFSVKSAWDRRYRGSEKHYSGVFDVNNPFGGCKRVSFHAKLVKSEEIKALMSFEFDLKKYEASFRSHWKKISDNMLVLNLTTPNELEKTSIRFGISARNRHVVAEIRSPIDSVGLEVVCQFSNATNYNFLVNLATPLDVMERFVVLASRKRARFDYKIKMNRFQTGLTASWVHDHHLHFDHAYKILTPIKGYEETGVVAKLLLENGLDTEFSVKVGTVDLGISATLVPKSNPEQELGFGPTKDKERYLVSPDRDVGSSLGDVSWTGTARIDSYVYKTIAASLDFRRKDTQYGILLTVDLPQGQIEITDELNLANPLQGKNLLRIKTPFENVKQITSNWMLQTTHDKNTIEYNVLLDLSVLKKSQRVEFGVEGNMLRFVDDGSVPVERYERMIVVRTPFETLPYFQGVVVEQHEGGSHGLNLTLGTKNATVSASIVSQSTEDLLDVTAKCQIDSNIFSLPPTKIHLRRTCPHTANHLDFRLQTISRSKKHAAEIRWNITSVRDFDVEITTHLPIQPLENVHFRSTNRQIETTRKFDMVFIASASSLHVNSTLDDSKLFADVLANFLNEQYLLNFNGVVEDESEARQKIFGVVYYDNFPSNVTSFVEYENTYPRSIVLDVIPSYDDDPVRVEYNLIKDGDKYDLTSIFTRGDTKASVKGVLEANNEYDWCLKGNVVTPVEEYKSFDVDARFKAADLKNVRADFISKSEMKGLELGEIHYGHNISEEQGRITSEHDLGELKGRLESNWHRIRTGEDVKFDLNAHQSVGNYSKDLDLNVYYSNANHSFTGLKIGGAVNVDKNDWLFGGDVSADVPTSTDLNIEAKIQLPKPNEDTHAFRLKIDKNKEKLEAYDYEYSCKYSTTRTEVFYSANAGMTYADKQNIDANLKINWGPEDSQSVENKITLKQNKSDMDWKYVLKTPLHPNSETLKIRATLKNSADYHNATFNLFHPSETNLISTEINFNTISNMDGFINVTTPVKKYQFVALNFDINEVSTRSRKHVSLSWPNNSVLYEASSNRKIGYGNQETATGTILIELPLKTRHTLQTNYEYEDKGVGTTGKAQVKLNNTEIVTTKYSSKSESKAGFDSDSYNIEVDNVFLPLGVNFARQYEYSAPGEGFNYPTHDLKTLEIYDLKNKTGFGLKADVVVKSDFHSDEIEVSVRDGRNLVSFGNNYTVADQVFEQKSRIRLTEELFLDCDLRIVNKTETEDLEAQDLVVSLSSPGRNLTIFGGYDSKEGELAVDAGLEWNGEDVEKRRLRKKFRWGQAGGKQEFEVRFLHPSFEKDVEFYGSFDEDESSAVLKIDYCNDEEKRLVASGSFGDESKDDSYDFVWDLSANHSDTDLRLSIEGRLLLDRTKLVLTGHNDARYKRKIFATEYGTIDAEFDVLNKFFDYKKRTRTTKSTFFGTYDYDYPVFSTKINKTYNEDEFESGIFQLNVINKTVYLQLNLTEDGSQSLNVRGKIPDARTASFLVHRDYDDIRIVDMSYLLNLNHSRLLVSSFRWRPELYGELARKIRTDFRDSFDYVLEEGDRWNKYIRFEVVEELSDLWDSGKPYIQGYLDDVQALKAFKNNVNSFETYFNKTYHENGFRFKQMYEYFNNLTEGANRKNLHVVVNEVIDQIGVGTLKGIPRIMEAMKENYENVKSFWSRMLNSDPMELFKTTAERIFEKSDECIENGTRRILEMCALLGEKIDQVVSKARGDFWKSLEPVVLEGGFYINKIWYHTVQDFIDYTNERIGDLINSDYFVSVANFFGRFDGIYQDYKANDSWTFCMKYITSGVDYINRKLFPDFSLRKGIDEIVTEVQNSWEELKNNTIIESSLRNVSEFWRSVRDVFPDIDFPYLKSLFFHAKDTYKDMTLTALEAENKYRIPKTELIFDVKKGLIHLEQKLPMSWHAFNETPVLTEIPEIQTIREIQNYFTTTNASFWNFYHDYKPYSTLAPPFDGRALLIGSKHIYTFDRRFYTLRTPCPYLLTSDFVDSKYSLVGEFDRNDFKNYKLHLFTPSGSVILDMSTRTVTVPRSSKTKLPLSLPDLEVFQESDVLTISSIDDYRLRCNMKYDVCIFDLGGWYFGKTAGLFGTFNNEPSDDFLSSGNTRSNASEFVESWTVGECASEVSVREMNVVFEELCDSLFGSKMSPFQACFQKVEPDAFKEMCLTSGSQEDVCTVAVGYIEVCRTENTPLRIPDTCVKCKLPNGTTISEGTFIQLNSTEIPKSTDTVFIMEAKACNSKLTTNKSIDLIISVLHDELDARTLTNNRYSLVVFGGDGIYNQPRSVIQEEVFTTRTKIPTYFRDIPAGDGSNDIYEALNFAAKLDFRPGVSKTFVLLPCSNCQSMDMKQLDYAALHQLLREYDITLHVLMNHEFQTEKSSGKINKILFGIDHNKAYTKTDSKSLKGDEDLRRQVRVSKSNLGLCVPLALETNGTVFNAKKFEAPKRSIVKMFAQVFAKRVAATAIPRDCQTCECNAHDHGASYMECFPCEYPTSSLIEQDFSEASPTFYDEITDYDDEEEDTDDEEE